MNRYNRLKELKLCDAYLIVSDAGRFYITNYKSSFGYAVYANGKPYFLTDFRYDGEARAFFNGQDIEIISGTVKEINAALQNILNNSAIKTIGYEDNRVSCSEYSEFEKMFVAKLVPAGKELDRLRYVKDNYEIEQIASAQAVTDKAFKKVLSYIKPGITERDICTELEYQLYRSGADGIAFDTIIASGANSSRPHCSVSKKKAEKGEFIILDFGAKVNGYCSDMTRTVALGKPDDGMVQTYGIVLAAQEKALEALKAGYKCRDAFMLVKDYFTVNNCEKEFLHGLGHGVGIEIHEGPTLNSTSEQILDNNMVVTVEPGIYKSNKFGVRIEDLAVITESGIRNLTVSDKELIIL